MTSALPWAHAEHDEQRTEHRSDPAHGGEFVRAELAARPADDAALRAEIIVQSAIACLDVTLTTWSNADDDTTASELLERSFATLRPQV